MPEVEEELLEIPEDEEILEDIEEETDEYGNPPGTEYDDDGNPIPEVEETTEEEAPVLVAARPAPATIHVQTGLTDQEREYAEEHLTPPQIALMEMIATRVASASQSSMIAANTSVENTLNGASSEYRAMMIPRMNAVVASMPPEQRSAARIGDAALMQVIAYEAVETGESVADVMSRHIQMRGASAYPARVKTPVSPKAPAVRAPSPTNAGRGPVVRSASSGAKSSTQYLAKSLGLTVREVEQMGLE